MGSNLCHFHIKEIIVQVANVNGGIHNNRVKVLNLQGEVTHSLNNIKNDDIKTLFLNYIDFISSVPDFSVSLQGPSIQFFEPIAGGHIPDARNYFILLQGILQQKSTNALQSNDRDQITGLFDLIHGLRQNLIDNPIYNGYDFSKVDTGRAEQADVSRIHMFLTQGMDILDTRLRGLPMVLS